jgi:uncharacterized caspase-like protein
MRAWVAVLLLLAAIMSASPARAERRVALAIGNSHYLHAESLNNPVDDAGAVAALLRSLGFEVETGIDLSAADLNGLLRAFGEKADGADIALFYYAGQGMAVNGATYLLPVDFKIDPNMDLRASGALDLDAALDQALKGATVRLVFYDASRSNPYWVAARPDRRPTPSAGLAEMRSGEGSLVGFACGPGQTAEDGPKGGHSPFTKALLENIGAPGVEIQQAMAKVRADVMMATDKRQLPWGSTNLIGTLYLNPAPSQGDRK